MKNRILVVILPVVVCCAFLPGAQGLTTPPDGCYPNFTTAEGCNALNSLTTGAGNTALGWEALFSDLDGSFNTAVGGGALIFNNGGANTAVGAAALLLNTTGTENTAVGTDAMVFNTVASFNNAFGAFALENNDSSGNGFANFNNAHGRNALFSNVDGGENNAFGDQALFANISGSHNTAVGDLALQFSTGDYNTALGASAGTDPGIVSNNIYIGDTGFAGDTNVIAIGGIAASGTDYTSTFIGGIVGAEVSISTAVPVYIDPDGHLGTLLVDANGNSAARRLPRVKGAQPQAMLNESRNQQKRIAELEGTVARLAAMVKEQAAQIQKVSAQLEMSKPAAKVVVNKQ